MTKLHSKLITTINYIIVISILSISTIISISQVVYHKNSFNKQVQTIRENYVNNQKKIIFEEVIRVVVKINNRILYSEEQVEQITKQRVYEAYSIADNLYKEYIHSKSESEIKKMIIDALRPLRFEDNLGYFFIQDYEGTVSLHSQTPELENSNMISVQDINGKYIFN